MIFGGNTINVSTHMSMDIPDIPEYKPLEVRSIQKSNLVAVNSTNSQGDIK
jgi:hypothetical protein